MRLSTVAAAALLCVHVSTAEVRSNETGLPVGFLECGSSGEAKLTISGLFSSNLFRANLRVADLERIFDKDGPDFEIRVLGSSVARAMVSKLQETTFTPLDFRLFDARYRFECRAGDRTEVIYVTSNGDVSADGQLFKADNGDWFRLARSVLAENTR